MYFYFKILEIIAFKLCFLKIIHLPELLVCRFGISLAVIYDIYVHKIHSFEQFSAWLDMLLINVQLSDFLEY